MRGTDLADQMKSFNVWEAWEAGRRGLRMGEMRRKMRLESAKPDSN